MTDSTALEQPAGINVTKIINKLTWHRRQRKRLLTEINALHEAMNKLRDQNSALRHENEFLAKNLLSNADKITVLRNKLKETYDD